MSSSTGILNQWGMVNYNDFAISCQLFTRLSPGSRKIVGRRDAPQLSRLAM